MYESRLGSVGPNRNYAGIFSLKEAEFYLAALPEMLGWVGVFASVVGLMYTFYQNRGGLFKWFWACWFLSYFSLVQVVGIYQENRYFIFALPAFAGWISATFNGEPSTALRKGLATALVSACLVANLVRFQEFPQGVIGHGPIAARLARLSERGNILISSPEQAQLIFSYRCYASPVQRSFIRADRSIVIRPPSYTDAPTTKLAQKVDDLLQIVRRGRIRYVVTSTNPLEPDQAVYETRILNEALTSNRNLFTLLDEFPLARKDRTSQRQGRVALWQFKGPLPEGASDLPVLVPTADLTLWPGG
jgi:hypothetical protein